MWHFVALRYCVRHPFSAFGYQWVSGSLIGVMRAPLHMLVVLPCSTYRASSCSLLFKALHPIPPFIIIIIFFYFSLIYSVSFPFFFQFIVTSARAGAGSVFFWWAGLVAWLEVGQALASVLAVWVWGQQFQSPMSLSTQPPFATKALILHYQPNYCNKINYYSIVRWRKKLFLVLLQ